MSSSPPTDAGRITPAHWYHPSGWPLRTRLVAALITLLALLGLAVGGTAEIFLRKQLYQRIDGELREATNRAMPGSAYGPLPSDNSHEGRGTPRRPPWNQPPPGAQREWIYLYFLPPGATTGALGGKVQLGPVGVDQHPQFDPVSSTGVISALASIPAGKTVDLSLGSLGRYRAMASTGRFDNAPYGVIVAAPLAPTDSTLLSVALFTGGAVLIALAIAGWAGALIIRRTLAPLDRVAATATRVSELRLDRGEVRLAQRVPDSDTDARTEVGQVGAALNRMLDHVGNALEARHASEMQVRQFVADASHELRTPLAAIRGYAELSRRSRAPIDGEVAHVLGRVESEAKRMTLLVEDLLLLARLDAGRPLAHDPVDLTALVVDAVSDAHAAGPRHHWQLDLPEEPVTVLGDQQRLHQVLANLLANARTHTPEGTTVTVAVSATADAAVLRVIDHGPGIPAELQPHIFERFARGDSSRSRAAGSTGLGLSIVHAVVTAHRGTVSVRSRPRETVFTVTLPVAPAAHVPPADQYARSLPYQR